MIPPLVTDPATNIKNPAPGMMVYDSAQKTASQYIMVQFGLIGDNLKNNLKYFFSKTALKGQSFFLVL
jgi:hypothetical protein